MNVGTEELTRATSAYLACLVFVVAFLVTTIAGGGGFTATIRGGIAAAIAFLLGRALLRPALSVVLDAMARDQAKKPPKKKPGEANP